MFERKVSGLLINFKEYKYLSALENKVLFEEVLIYLCGTRKEETCFK